MSGPSDFRDLVGEDVPADELEKLRRVDALLRRVPAPPAEVPLTLTERVARLSASSRPLTRRRAGLVLAFAVTVAALFFGLGRWTDGAGFDTSYSVDMQPTAAAANAWGVIRVGERDEGSGNWELELEVAGLPRLPSGAYYTLWLAKDGEYAGTCGTFAVGEGTTTVRMTVSYRLRDYDAWVITAASDEDEPPWLLRADVS